MRYCKPLATSFHRLSAPTAGSTFFGPTLAEIPLTALPDREVFGPVLHVVRYEAERLEETCAALAAKGYGLTVGVHSRIERLRLPRPDAGARGQRLCQPVYHRCGCWRAAVWRPRGCPAPGPRRAVPMHFYGFAVERAVSVNIAAQGGDPALINL